ncbi:MAG: FIST N-terminal domain-containing protein [Planctomycetota bacterium]
MEWVSVAAQDADVEDILDALVEDVRAGLGEAEIDLAFVFLASEHAVSARRVAVRLREWLGGPALVGFTAQGVIGGRREYERVPAISVLAGRLPGAGVHTFHLSEHDLPDPDAPPAAWHAAVGLSPADAPAFVLLADPHSLDTERLLEGLDFAYPATVKVGGLASGATRPGGEALLLGDRVHGQGAVGVALMGDVALVPVLAQGCRAIGVPLRITACRGRLLTGLDERPAAAVLCRVLEDAGAPECPLAEHAVALGFETDPLTPGTTGPWSVRAVLGPDEDSGGLYVDAALRPGRRVLFHVRDEATSRANLELALAGVPERTGVRPLGALVFSCLDRGLSLYGRPDHETRTFDRYFDGAPLGGCFCRGEIAPLGTRTHLHALAASFALLAPARAAPPPSVSRRP